MPTQDSQIAEMLERELRANPHAATAALQEKASEIKRGTAKLSLRSFHATYVGSVKRRISGKTGGRRKSSMKPPGKRSTGRTKGGLDTLARASYDEKRTAMLISLEEAFERAVAADTLSGLEKLLAKMDKAERMF